MPDQDDDYGMPIVASASGGVPELITEKTGWTVQVGSLAADYARVIEAVLADPEKRRTRRLCPSRTC